MTHNINNYKKGLVLVLTLIMLTIINPFKMFAEDFGTIDYNKTERITINSTTTPNVYLTINPRVEIDDKYKVNFNQSGVSITANAETNILNTMNYTNSSNGYYICTDSGNGTCVFSETSGPVDIDIVDDIGYFNTLTPNYDSNKDIYYFTELQFVTMGAPVNISQLNWLNSYLDNWTVMLSNKLFLANGLNHQAHHIYYYIPKTKTPVSWDTDINAYMSLIASTEEKHNIKVSFDITVSQIGKNNNNYYEILEMTNNYISTITNTSIYGIMKLYGYKFLGINNDDTSIQNIIKFGNIKDTNNIDISVNYDLPGSNWKDDKIRLYGNTGKFTLEFDLNKTYDKLNKIIPSGFILDFYQLMKENGSLTYWLTQGTNTWYGYKYIEEDNQNFLTNAFNYIGNILNNIITAINNLSIGSGEILDPDWESPIPDIKNVLNDIDETTEDIDLEDDKYNIDTNQKTQITTLANETIIPILETLEDNGLGIIIYAPLILGIAGLMLL